MRKINISIREINRKQQGHLNKIQRLVKEAETLRSDTEDFPQNFFVGAAMKKELGDSGLARKKTLIEYWTREVFDEEEEIHESAVTRNVETCQVT